MNPRNLRPQQSLHFRPRSSRPVLQGVFPLTDFINIKIYRLELINGWTLTFILHRFAEQIDAQGDLMIAASVKLHRTRYMRIRIGDHKLIRHSPLRSE